MKYLVTGGAGFIGSNFIHYLFREYPDAQIVNFDNLTYAGNLANLKIVEGDKRYRFIKGDITDPAAVDAAVADCDVVVNFAAETHVDRSILGPAEFVRTNVLGTQVILDAVKKHGKRFHHISTDEVFGSLDFNSGIRFTEATPYDPSSPYAASKAAADHIVRAYHKTFGVKATISNCSNNYGPYQFIEKLIPLAITNALSDKKIPVYGNGQHVRDWIHVEDHCAAIDLILQKGEIGQTYVIGGDSEESNLHIVKAILKFVGKSEDLIEFVGDRPGHDKRYGIDSHKITFELGFRHKYNLNDGLRQTVDWYTHHKDWWQALISKDYLNYYETQYKNR
jgi:dTDP-glucose 4,6-dehydratase